MENKPTLYCDACGKENPPTYKDTRCTTCCAVPDGLYSVGLDGLYGVGKSTTFWTPTIKTTPASLRLKKKVEAACQSHTGEADEEVMVTLTATELKAVLREHDVL